jgi:tetratricopeptide (TPR) repeat protein
MLVPMIGILQVGTQAMADRYTYLASVGLFIAVLWLGFDLLARRPSLKLGFGAVMTAAAAALAPLAIAQVPLWRNTEILFQHALKVTKGSIVVYNVLGAEAERRDNPDKAIAYYKESIKIADNAEARHNLGNLFFKKSKNDEAVHQFQAALHLKPRLAATHNSLGNVLVALRRMGEAVEHYKLALKYEPGLALAHYNYAMALEDCNKLAEAAEEYAIAGRLGFLNKLGKYAEAEGLLSKATVASPNLEAAQFEYGVCLDRLGKHAEAIEQYGVVLQLWHDHADTLSNLALIYATTPNSDLRSAKMAVLLATRACVASSYGNPTHLDVLARASAADNDFPSAIKWEERAILHGQSNMDKKIVAEMHGRLSLYNLGRAN